jgi:hypothetical protein
METPYHHRSTIGANLWEQQLCALLAERNDVDHPLGCLTAPPIPDRERECSASALRGALFAGVGVRGCASYWRVSEERCSATTLRRCRRDASA